MKIFTEKSLKDFEFWSGAVDRTKILDDDDFDVIEQNLEELYPDGCDETFINDFFWFEEDTIAEWLGFSSWEELEASKSDEESE